eukprot:15437152-Alexandrium_andersonii.AAC.1
MQLVRPRDAREEADSEARRALLGRRGVAMLEVGGSTRRVRRGNSSIDAAAAPVDLAGARSACPPWESHLSDH